jgi:CheY-like chemotaxis protein
MGVESYLVKPVRLHELREAVGRILAPEVPTAREQPPTAASAPVPAGPALNILLAEDNAVNVMVMKRMLQKRGHTVTVVGDGRRAIEAVADGNIDLVFMDVQMPELDGLEATQEIRKREAGGHIRIPIFALTAHAMKSDRDVCVEAGMDGYLTKPINTKELDEILNIYAARHFSDDASVELAG